MSHLSASLKLYIIIALISIIFSLYLSEAYFTLNSFHNKPQSVSLDKSKVYKKITGKEYDERSKLEIYSDLKRNNSKISVVVPPFYFINKKTDTLPLSNQSNNIIINCNENGYYSINKTDRYGFNNPNEEWDKEEIEYVLIGDSFVYGDCVNRPHDISSVLRILSNKPVLNLGQKGNGPLLEYATLKEYVQKNVKNIIWVFYENDINNLNFELTSKKLNNYFNDKNYSQNLQKNQKIVDKLVFNNIQEVFNEEKRASYHLVKNDKKKYKILKFVRLNKTKSFLKSLVLDKKTLSKFKEILSQAKNFSLENGSNFYFVYIPRYKEGKIKYNNKLFRNIKKITEEIEISLIDVQKLVLAKENNSNKLYPFGNKGHFNIEGYRKVAKSIYDFTSD